MEEKKYLIYLHYIGFNHKDFYKIFKSKNNYSYIYENLRRINFYALGINKQRTEKIINTKINIELLDKIIENNNIKIICHYEKNFPENLKHISNKPYFLYIKGNIPNHRFFGVVGSREISEYGIKVIKSIIPQLAEKFTIISGGAKGIDTYVHKYSNHNTIVVIGTGIDSYYPKENKNLFNEIVKNGGAIISIFPINTDANKYNFPIRNEIISGLSEGLLIIEAKEKSGSLITAKLGLEQGKDIFAIPGSIFHKQSEGVNNLIKNGEAKLISNYQDILNEYSFDTIKPKNKILVEYNDIEKKIITNIKKEFNTQNELAKCIEINILELSIILSEMELKGYIKKDISGKYILNNLI